MKVFLLQDVLNVGGKNEIVKVADGFAANFLFPRKLAIQVTPENEISLAKRLRIIEKRSEKINSKTSLLAESIKDTVIVIKRKAHDKDKLYASIGAQEVVDALAAEKIYIKKSQVEFGKSIKTTGDFDSVVINLSSTLHPKLKKLRVIAE